MWPRLELSLGRGGCWHSAEAAAMKKTHTMPWDPAEHPATEEGMVAYLNVALEDGDLRLIMATLGDIARARGGSVVAEEMGLDRERLHKSLYADSNPDFATELSRWLAPWEYGYRLRPLRKLIRG